MTVHVLKNEYLFLILPFGKLLERTPIGPAALVKATPSTQLPHNIINIGTHTSP